MGSCLMVPLFEQNLLGLQKIPRQFFLQVYHTFLHIGETRYLWLLSFLPDPLITPTFIPIQVTFILFHMGPWEHNCSITVQQVKMRRHPGQARIKSQQHCSKDLGSVNSLPGAG